MTKRRREHELDFFGGLLLAVSVGMTMRIVGIAAVLLIVRSL